MSAGATATARWGAAGTICLLAGSVSLLLAFVVIELRSRAPLLPVRIVRAASATMAVVGAATFAQFFLLTFFMQEVFRYSAVQTGVTFAPFAVAANVAQAVVSRLGVRPTLTTGLVAYAVSVALLSRLRVDGRYFWDLFPALVLGGVGVGLSFVSATIASLSGVGASVVGVLIAATLVRSRAPSVGSNPNRSARQPDLRADEELRRR